MSSKPVGNQMTPSVRKTHRKRKTPKALSKKQYIAVSDLINNKINKRTEKKYYDSHAQGQAADYAGGTSQLTTIAQGDDVFDRNGDEAYLRSVRVKGSILNGDATNIFRLLVVQFFGNTADDTFQMDDIFGTAYIGSVSLVNAPYVHDLRKNINVMYDRSFTLNDELSPCLFDTGYLKIAKRKIIFSQGATTATNHIYLVRMSDSAAAAHPQVTWLSRVTFNDS